MSLVAGFGCNAGSSLLVRYMAPIFMMGSPIAAQIPAISSSIMGLGNKKYAMQEKSGMVKPTICIKVFLVVTFSKTRPIEIK